MYVVHNRNFFLFIYLTVNLSDKFKRNAMKSILAIKKAKQFFIERAFLCTSTCVLPGRATFYYCLGDDNGLLWPKLCLLKCSTWYSREPSH